MIQTWIVGVEGKHADRQTTITGYYYTFQD